MTTVRLVHTSEIRIDLDVDSWEYASAASDTYGKAQFTVPRTSEACSPAYIAPDGGSYIEIDHPLLGLWRGIVQRPQQQANGDYTCEAWEMLWLASMRHSTLTEVYQHVSAGQIVRDAVAGTLQGLGRGAIQLGTFVEAPPLIPEYAPAGKSLETILRDMQDATGQEPQIDEAGRFNWLPAAGIFYTRWLCGGSDVENERSQPPSELPAAEAIAIAPNGQTYPARAGDVSGSGYNQRQVIVQVQSVADLGPAAEQALARARSGSRLYTMSLMTVPPYRLPGSSDRVPRGLGGYATSARVHLETLREGMIVQLCLPAAGMGGAAPLGRIHRRRYGDRMAAVEIEVQEIPQWDASTIAFAADMALPRFMVAEDVFRALKATPRVTAVLGKDAVGGKELAGQAVSGAHIAPGAVDTAALAPLAVTPAELAASAVTEPKIAAGAVTNAKISDVDPDKVNAGTFDPGVKLAAGELAAGTVPSGVVVPLARLGSGSVPGTITMPLGQLEPGTLAGVDVPTSLLVGTVDNTQIAAAAVENTQLAAGAVDGPKTAFAANTGTGIATGTAEALPPSPDEYLIVKNAAGQDRRIPAWI